MNGNAPVSITVHTCAVVRGSQLTPLRVSDSTHIPSSCGALVGFAMAEPVQLEDSMRET